MTLTPVRARGLVDPVSGAVLALTGHAATWIGPDGTRADLTPEHDVACAAIGGGAVALAGDDVLTWQDGSGSRTVAAPPLHRVAVAGRLVAGCTVDGDVVVWPDVEGAAVHGTTGLDADGIALDAVRGRVAVWGWRPDGRAALVVAGWGGRGWAEVRQAADQPEPVAGVAFPVLDGAVAVGTEDAVLVVAATGEQLRRLDLDGLESLAASGSGATLAWIRVPAAPQRIRVGCAGLGGTAVHEWDLPGSDPVHMALAADDDPSVTLVEGVGPGRLMVHRSTPDGWAPPSQIDIGRRQE